MRISVIGCGYLGAVHAVCMAKLGHEVVGIDVLEAQVAALSEGRAPFYEPGLDSMLNEALSTGRLHFSTDAAAAFGAETHFICVGTPQKPADHSADLSQLDDAVESLLPHLSPGDVVVGKSTVPVGTAARLAACIESVAADVVLAWNPEFLREGFAIQDTLHPNRIVYGIPAGEPGARAKKALDDVYARTLAEGAPTVVTDYMTAELVKVAANSFLATKISFINAMAELCDVTGGDVTELADAIGYDERIGRRFLNAGVGFGGGCLPKDIRAFMARAGELGADQALAFLREVDSINMRSRLRMVELAREECGGSVVGARVAVLGGAFKPDSDDVRDSPALSVAAQLQIDGADVVVTDPKAIDNAQRKYPDLSFASRVEDAVAGADIVLLLTEWRAYLDLDPVELGRRVRKRRMLDCRNALDPKQWRAAGWTYRAPGRP
jgi:UDPglucose 6-dehydrogenase